MMVVDFVVLFYFSKSAIFFMILKAERLKLEEIKISKCDAFIVIWTLFLFIAYTVLLISKAIFAPLPLLSEP